ncbi:hypothetical protein QM012_006225 [Aureobasidium pullulans]|uniref:C3H1-type domain-containing protein n=1 Tax=Aureobasidium pullulans TaxID=5580 RepID=A0ABR0TS38_AURPU
MITHEQHIEVYEAIKTIRSQIHRIDPDCAEANTASAERLYQQATQALNSGDESAVWKFKNVLHTYRAAFRRWDTGFFDPFSGTSQKYERYPFGPVPVRAGSAPGLPAPDAIQDAVSRLTNDDAYRNLFLCVKAGLKLDEGDMETLAQRSSILHGGAPIHEPMADFSLEHAVEVCEVMGYSLVVSAPGPGRVWYTWFTKPKPGTKPIVFYNSQAIFGDKTIYFGRWYYLQPPPAGGNSKKISHATIASAPISTPASVPALHQQRFPTASGSSNEVRHEIQAPSPALVPQQQRPCIAGGSSNEVRDKPQAAPSAIQQSSSPVPSYPHFDRNAYGALRPVQASNLPASLQRWHSLSKAEQIERTDKSKPMRSKLPPRIVELEVDKSKYPQPVDIMRIPDVMGRRANNTFVRSNDLSPVTPAWIDHIASLIGNLCPMNLDSRPCVNQEGCIHKHICPAWKNGTKQEASPHRMCEHKEIEHEGLVHILPTCSKYLKGKCKRPSTECGFGHDHMEVRTARKDMLRQSNEAVKATNVYPPQVIHEIKYV